MLATMTPAQPRVKTAGKTMIIMVAIIVVVTIVITIIRPS